MFCHLLHVILAGIVITQATVGAARIPSEPLQGLRLRIPYKSPHTLQKRAAISFEVPAFGQNQENPSQLDFFEVETCEGKEDAIRDFFADAQTTANAAAQNLNDPGSAALLKNLFSFGGQSPAVNTISRRYFQSFFLPSMTNIMVGCFRSFHVSPMQVHVLLTLDAERLNAAAALQNVFIICESDNKGQGDFYRFMGSFPGECDKRPAPLAASYALSHGYFASQTDKSLADQAILERKFGGNYMILCDRGFNLDSLDAVTERFNIDTQQQEENGIEPGELLQDGLCDYGNNHVSNILHELMHLSSFDLGSFDVQGMSLPRRAAGCCLIFLLKKPLIPC